MPKVKRKHKVLVSWVYAVRHYPRETTKLWNGLELPVGAHDFRPEGTPTKRIWCEGCKKYFNSWAEILWAHGARKTAPKKEEHAARPRKSKP